MYISKTVQIRQDALRSSQYNKHRKSQRYIRYTKVIQQVSFFHLCIPFCLVNCISYHMPQFLKFCLFLSIIETCSTFSPRLSHRIISNNIVALCGSSKNEEEKTLYQILNSPQNATRTELKNNYIALVRQTHPDAKIGVENYVRSDDEFQTITQAWKTLSNPLERKRYDRMLRAKVFTKDFENAMDEIGKTAGPQFLNVFENVAIPFMRKGAATVTAGINAVSKDLKTYNEQDKKDQGRGINGILTNAYSATKKAGNAIDMLDMMEKSNELKKK